jgi:MoxR-like ATPase
MSNSKHDWKIFHGDNRAPHEDINQLPDAPGWRPFGRSFNPGANRRKRRGETFQARPQEVEMVNAALYLRRPLLLTGNPGTGKSSLAYAVARELTLGEVLYWPITTRTTLKEGLYTYDAIGRLQEAKQSEARGKQGDEPQKLANYITLGPLGTALLPSPRPRVLIIDEIDKSDIDLPNDLLTIFEEGRFEIPELARLEQKDSNHPPTQARVRTAYTDDEEWTRQDKRVSIQGGRIACQEFPLVFLTSNGERDFPAPFLRRCLRLTMRDPDRSELEQIIKAQLKECDISDGEISQLIDQFIARRRKGKLATDQLLNALFMILRDRDLVRDRKSTLIDRLLASLEGTLES